jgi:hypothetical protein
MSQGLLSLRAHGRALAVLTAALLTAMVAVPIATAKPASAASVGVFVGYADNLRASPFFPTPWQGDPNVNFQGAGPTFDAGAIRIDNGTTSPVTVDSVTVDIGVTHLAIWPANMVIPATSGINNGHLILTQTTAFNFDTSDVGLLANACSPDGLIPVVHVTIGGVTTDFSDTTQILNTKGVDKAACPNGSNESIPWGAIGVPNDPPVLTVPGALTSEVTDQLTFGISATDKEGDFILLGASGLPAALTFTDHGNGTGTVSGLLQLPAGTSQVATFSAEDGFNPPVFKTVKISSVLDEAHLSYTGDTHIANGTPARLAGVLTEDGGVPIAGRTVTFTLGTGANAQTCTGVTDSTGAASCTIASVNQPPGAATVPISAVFAGDSTFVRATASATAFLLFMTGRAFGLSASASVLGLVNLTVAPTPDTGQVTTANAVTVAPPCVATLSGLVSASALCANVTTTVNPGTSTANASVADVSINIATLPVISAHLVQARSRSTCAGASGSATIASLTIAGVAQLNLNPAPNTSIALAGGGAVILNEQSPVPGADFGLTVNAIHVSVHLLGVNVDVIVASATSDIHNCGGAHASPLANASSASSAAERSRERRPA